MGIYETLRVDAWGWTIVRQDYGKTGSRYGWEIDHIVPVALGGKDDLSNLQPLQWENNRRKDEIQGIPQTLPQTIKQHAAKAQRAGQHSHGQGQAQKQGKKH